MPVRLSIESVCFNDGTQLDMEPDDIVVFVGSNNAGKTSSLREIVARLKGDEGKVVASVTTRKDGSVEEVIAWLDSNYSISQRDQERVLFTGYGASVWSQQVPRSWNGDRDLGNLTPFFCKLIMAEGRLQASNPTNNIDLLREPIQNPLQAVLADISIEERLSNAFKQAFGIPLFLNRWSGTRLRMHTGERPTGTPWTKEHLEAIQQIPELETQGDGMRSYVSCLLESSVSKHGVVLLDEPEAFLHPPQARLLGRMLARDKQPGKQLFIATHSVDLLRGLLDARTDNVRVVRLRRRSDDINLVSELDSSRIRELWGDSILRASNILDGLFHEAVVVCEGDADCRFYSSIVDAFYDAQAERKRPDLMFVHSGGKAKMHTVITALRKVDVPVIAITDFDVLRQQSDIQRIIEALGGNWASFEPNWRAVKNSLDQKAPPLSLNQVKQEITRILSEETGTYLGEQAATAIRNQLKAVSAWATAKESGKSSVPSGQVMNCYNDLSRDLRNVGLFIVECGELERFAPTVGGHGPTWVNAVLDEKNLLDDAELETARAFVRSLLGYIGCDL